VGFLEVFDQNDQQLDQFPLFRTGTLLIVESLQNGKEPLVSSSFCGTRGWTSVNNRSYERTSNASTAIFPPTNLRFSS
jgi:hypothetical protein